MEEDDTERPFPESKYADILAEIKTIPSDAFNLDDLCQDLGHSSAEKRTLSKCSEREPQHQTVSQNQSSSRNETSRTVSSGYHQTTNSQRNNSHLTRPNKTGPSSIPSIIHSAKQWKSKASSSSKAKVQAGSSMPEDNDHQQPIHPAELEIDDEHEPNSPGEQTDIETEDNEFQNSFNHLDHSRSNSADIEEPEESEEDFFLLVNSHLRKSSPISRENSI